MDGHWKIIEFAKLIGKHYNTVDGWFKKLEKEKIHYINRAVGTEEKVYDSLDLQIAKYIDQKRTEKWSLDGIFSVLPDEFEMRPFPVEENNSQVMDIEALKQQMKEEWTSVFEQYAATLERKFLPDPEAERQQRATNMITEFRIKSNLENEALGVWSKKPEEERMKKVGWFRKEEDREKREDFVKRYIREHFESRIREEFDVKSES